MTDRAVSSDALDAVVDEFMKQDALDNAIIPDVLERKLYKNVLKLVLTSLHEILKTTSVDLLGHRMTLKLEPISSN